jgi:hypothetical protein
MSEPATTLPPLPPHLSPKSRFLSLEESAKAWRTLARSDLMTTALTHGFAEFALSSPEPTAEQIRAVRNFMDTLLNLAEPKSPPPTPFPDKRLSPMPSEATDKKPSEGKK